jgi:hypothetical protein
MLDAEPYVASVEDADRGVTPDADVRGRLVGAVTAWSMAWG